MALTRVASYLTTTVAEVDFVKLEMKANTIEAELKPQRRNAGLIIFTTHLPTSYSSTVPITLAIIAALYPFIKRKIACAEAIAILLLVNVLVLFCKETGVVSLKMMQLGFYFASDLKRGFWNFLSVFMGTMETHLVPFLIGACLYMRNPPPRSHKEKV
jgi:hypothetical protein